MYYIHLEVRGIKRRFVLYRGVTAVKEYDEKRIELINIEEFLLNMGKYLD